MMKKILLSVAISILTLTSFAQAVKKSTVSNQIENKNAAEIVFEVEEFDFGTIKQGEKVAFSFNFENAGKDPLIISNAQGTCGCTVPEWPKGPISKNGRGTIHVEFNSAGKIGMQDKTVTVSSNARNGQVVLHLKGNVEAPGSSKGEIQGGKK